MPNSTHPAEMSVHQMTLHEKLGQMLLVGFEGLEAPDHILERLAKGQISGVILFARNVESPEQVARLTESIHAAARFPALISIDQEGGTVARLRVGFSESPGAMALAAAQAASAAQTDSVARTQRVSGVLGEEMRALGINWVYAPSVDILHNIENPTLGTRSFGADAETICDLAAAAVTGFQGARVAATAKHFPGLGDTAVDTHLALATLEISEAELMARDMLPYRAALGAGAASVMTTHTILSTLDPDLPVTLSPIVIGRLLRGALGFEGVITTDCMEMKAIADHFGAGESAVLAALAGVDIILFSHTQAMQEAAYAGLIAGATSGRIPEGIINAAVARIAALKAQYAVTDPPDMTAIRTPEHLDIVREAARAGTVLLYGTFPPRIDPAERIIIVEFASVLESGIVEAGGQTGFCRLIQARLPDATLYTLKSWALEAETVEHLLETVNDCDLLILATRNACWNPEQRTLAEPLMARAKRTVLVCLRTPYDAPMLPRAEFALCTCGDSAPSLDAAVDALMGDFVPNGRLPITISPA